MPALLRGALSAIVVAALALGLWALASAQTAVGITLGLALGVAGPHLARHVRERTWDRLGGGAALLLGLGGIAWALAFDSMQTSDFGVYWRCGTESAGSLSAQLERCQSRYMAPTPLFWLRSLLSTRPLGLLLGARPQAFDVSHALLHAVALGLLLVAVRRALGPAPAAVAVLVWGLFPERLFAITLASSDNVAAVVVVAALALAARVEERPAVRALQLGFALAALELLRNTGPIFAVGAVLAAVAGRRGRGFAVTVGAVVLAGLLVRGLIATLPVKPEARGVAQTLAAVDLSTQQTFDVALRWLDHVLPAVPPAERTAFSTRKLLDELSQGAARYPTYLTAKARMMFTGAGYAGWAALDLPSNPDTALTVPHPTVPSAPPGLLAGLLGLALSLAVVGAARTRSAPLVVVASSCCATFFAAVLLFSEAQPRYLFVVGPALAVLAAASFTREAPAWDLALPRGVLAVGAALALGGAWLAQRRPPSLTEARLVDAVDCGGAASLSGAAQRLRVELPAGVRCAEVRVPLGRPARRARLVVTQATFPFPFEPRSDPGLAWAVQLGDAHAGGQFGGQTAEFVSLSSPGDALRLRVTRADAATPAALELAHVQPD